MCACEIANIDLHSMLAFNSSSKESIDKTHKVPGRKFQSINRLVGSIQEGPYRKCISAEGIFGSMESM
jgi:hypothetical protein